MSAFPRVVCPACGERANLPTCAACGAPVLLAERWGLVKLLRRAAGLTVWEGIQIRGVASGDEAGTSPSPSSDRGASGKKGRGKAASAPRGAVTEGAEGTSVELHAFSVPWLPEDVVSRLVRVRLPAAAGEAFVPVVDSFATGRVEGRTLWVVFERPSGSSLAARTADRPLEPERVASLTESVLSALVALHDAVVAPANAESDAPTEVAGRDGAPVESAGPSLSSGPESVLDARWHARATWGTMSPEALYLDDADTLRICAPIAVLHALRVHGIPAPVDPAAVAWRPARPVEPPQPVADVHAVAAIALGGALGHAPTDDEVDPTALLEELWEADLPTPLRGVLRDALSSSPGRRPDNPHVLLAQVRRARDDAGFADRLQFLDDAARPEIVDDAFAAVRGPDSGARASWARSAVVGGALLVVGAVGARMLSSDPEPSPAPVPVSWAELRDQALALPADASATESVTLQAALRAERARLAAHSEGAVALADAEGRLALRQGQLAEAAALLALACQDAASSCSFLGNAILDGALSNLTLAAGIAALDRSCSAQPSANVDCTRLVRVETRLLGHHRDARAEELTAACARGDEDACWRGARFALDEAPAGALPALQVACDAGRAGSCGWLAEAKLRTGAVDAASTLAEAACEAGDAYACSVGGRVALGGASLDRGEKASKASGGDTAGAGAVRPTKKKGAKGKGKGRDKKQGAPRPDARSAATGGESAPGGAASVDAGRAAEARTWFVKGCDRGDGESCAWLGGARPGLGALPESGVETDTFLARACAADDAASCGALAAGTDLEARIATAPAVVQTALRGAARGPLAAALGRRAAMLGDAAMADRLLAGRPDDVDLAGVADQACARGTQVARDCTLAASATTDVESRIRTLARACAAPADTACGLLGPLLDVPTALADPRAGREGREAACTRGHADACGGLGRMLLRGDGGAVDAQRAATVLHGACQAQDHWCVAEQAARAAAGQSVDTSILSAAASDRLHPRSGEAAALLADSLATTTDDLQRVVDLRVQACLGRQVDACTTLAGAPPPLAYLPGTVASGRTLDDATREELAGCGKGAATDAGCAAVWSVALRSEDAAAGKKAREALAGACGQRSAELALRGTCTSYAWALATGRHGKVQRALALEAWTLACDDGAGDALACRNLGVALAEEGVVDAARVRRLLSSDPEAVLVASVAHRTMLAREGVFGKEVAEACRASAAENWSCRLATVLARKPRVAQ